jgi:hypothetical protein
MEGEDPMLIAIARGSSRPVTYDPLISVQPFAAPMVNSISCKGLGMTGGI